MTLVAVECPVCATATELPAASLLVEVDGPDPVDDRMAGTAVWICRPCGDLVAIPVAWSALLSLVTAGARLVDEGLPGAVSPSHPEHPSPGPAFAPDDLLDLHALLERPDWFDQLTSPVDSACSDSPS